MQCIYVQMNKFVYMLETAHKLRTALYVLSVISSEIVQ